MKLQPTVKIKPTELRNICKQFEFNEDCKLTDTDESYAIKKALSRLPKSDFIIYCLYIEIGVKTEVGRILGISRISVTKILKDIENKIKEYIEDDLHKPTDNPSDTGLHS